MSIASPTAKGPTSTSTIAPEPEAARLLAQLHDLLDQYASAVRPADAAGLHLTVAECNQIEDVTGLGTTRNAAQLTIAVQRLASIRIGDIRIPFTPGQLEEIAHRAAKRGHTVEQEMRAAVARIEDELFYRKGA